MALINTQNSIHLVALLALVSCVAPKAIGVAEAPVEKKEVIKVVSDLKAKPPATILVNDGIRLPDMLTMPTERELLPTNPIKPQAEFTSGAVISRPPSDSTIETKLTSTDTKKLN